MCWAHTMQHCHLWTLPRQPLGLVLSPSEPHIKHSQPIPDQWLQRAGRVRYSMGIVIKCNKIPLLASGSVTSNI